ncbi:MAG: hypothetical protein BWZ02_02881 [Lentisphaerae bacterium ADurb.BinA184]|nr:MAG: hypothetical protein BWZ02_02881 [Lentisphaerae bacterium ADurb.BinA184]
MNDTTSGTKQNPTRQDTRFPPGQSGNPAGRPRRNEPAVILRAAIARRLREPVSADIRRMYERAHGARVTSVGEALAVEATAISTDGAPDLAAIARLLEAVRE